MRIAARWMGWYSLATATAALVAMVLVSSAPLWLERPRRVTACKKDIADLVVALRHACAERHDARACRRFEAWASQQPPALLVDRQPHHRNVIFR